MSRTFRAPRPKFWRFLRRVDGTALPRRVRDGDWQYADPTCAHNNGCPYCVRNRTHSTRRQAPIEEMP